MGCNTSGDKRDDDSSDSENEAPEPLQKQKPKSFDTLKYILAEREQDAEGFALAAAPGRGWSRTNNLKQRIKKWLNKSDEFKEKKELVGSVLAWVQTVNLKGKILFDLMLEYDEDEGYYLDEDLVEGKDKPEDVKTHYDAATPEICEALFKFRESHAKEFMVKLQDDKERVKLWACMVEWQKDLGEITCMCSVGMKKIAFGDSTGKLRIRQMLKPFDGWHPKDRDSEAPVGGEILDLAEVIPSHYKDGAPSDAKYGITSVAFVASPEYKSGFLCGTVHPTSEGDAETSTKQAMHAIYAWDVSQLLPIDVPKFHPSHVCKGPEEPAVITACGDHIVAGCTTSGTIYWAKLEAVKLDPEAEGEHKPAEVIMKKFEDSKDSILSITGLAGGKNFVASCAGGKLKMFAIEGGEVRAIGESKTAKEADCPIVVEFPEAKAGEKGASIIACDGKSGITVVGLKDGVFDGNDPASYDIGGEGKAGDYQCTCIAPVRGSLIATGGSNGTIFVFSLADGKAERIKKFEGTHTDKLEGLVCVGKDIPMVFSGSKCKKISVFGTFTQKLKDARDELEA